MVTAQPLTDLMNFEEVVLRYEKKIYNLTYRMLLNEEDAKDLTQETFLRVYSSLASFRGDASLGTYLYRVATNLCLDLIRRRRYSQGLSLEAPGVEGERPLLERLSDERNGTDQEVERRELQRAVGQAVAALEEDHRAVIILREYNGLSYEEIAQVLEISTGTVKSRLNRAKARLRRELFDFLNVKNGKGGGGR
ncbi:MAG: sigma-70 family RNA polymerase sigma factor [Firmicutes bacterium]|nr:sigma-70 family RNA polymerase sigma factor [Bacillota bacterium]